MDARQYPATARVAHRSLSGQTSLPLTDGADRCVAVALADLLNSQGGARERQLGFGEGFVVIDEDLGHAFGFAKKDGYCGWLPEAALGPAFEPTHWVATPGTHSYERPKVQRREGMALSLGARLRVTGQGQGWAETPIGFVPAPHLLPMGEVLRDPVTVAEGFVQVPYLWGGNSRAGLDCSGLVQMAHLACGLPCPGDSDQQQAMGAALPETAALRRGDLLFWRGHVALVVDGQRLIHANGHSMSVAYEPIGNCIQRIAAQGGGPVTHRRRLPSP